MRSRTRTTKTPPGRQNAACVNAIRLPSGNQESSVGPLNRPSVRK